jgi:hypothetical protein
MTSQAAQMNGKQEPISLITDERRRESGGDLVNMAAIEDQHNTDFMMMLEEGTLHQVRLKSVNHKK